MGRERFAESAAISEMALSDVGNWLDNASRTARESVEMWDVGMTRSAIRVGERG
jgi:hypothetical protein